MKKYNLVPADMHLILNLVSSSQSFRTAEGWTPICLPNLDPRSLNSNYKQIFLFSLNVSRKNKVIVILLNRNYNLRIFFVLSGYLQAHVSYLSEDCEACLVLLTVDRELFFQLSEAKLKIVEVRIC